MLVIEHLKLRKLGIFRDQKMLLDILDDRLRQRFFRRHNENADVRETNDPLHYVDPVDAGFECAAWVQKHAVLDRGLFGNSFFPTTGFNVRILFYEKVASN